MPANMIDLPVGVSSESREREPVSVGVGVRVRVRVRVRGAGGGKGGGVAGKKANWSAGGAHGKGNGNRHHPALGSSSSSHFLTTLPAYLQSLGSYQLPYCLILPTHARYPDAAYHLIEVHALR